MGKPGRADRTITVQHEIPAPPEAIFDILANPHRHHEIDGSGMLRGAAKGPDRLSLGKAFSLAMTQSRLPYRSRNEVVEFDDNRTIAWRTIGRWKGHEFIGGQVWRYHLIPTASGTTLVQHSYDWGAARYAPALRVLGYPRKMAAAMPRTLERLGNAARAAEPTD